MSRRTVQGVLSGAIVVALVMSSGLPVGAQPSDSRPDFGAERAQEAADLRSELERELEAALFGNGLPAELAAQAAPFSEIEAPVVVTGIAVQETTAQVTLAWNDVDSLDKFVVSRNGVEFDTTVPTFTETVPLGVTYEYAVRSVEDSKTVGETSVALLKLDRGCDLLWTGSADDDFADADNWAPVGVAPFTQRSPGATDHICIDTIRNTPVTSNGANAFFDRASSALDPATPLLDVKAGDLTAGTSIEKLPVAISGGTLATKGPAEFTSLTMNGGTLDLGSNVTVTRSTGVGAGTIATTISASVPASLNVTEMSLLDADLVLSGPVELTGFMTRLDGASTIVDGTAGAKVITELIEASSGKGQIDVRVSSQLTVRNGADLTVSKHDALTADAIANGDVLPRVDVDGKLTLSQPVTRFGSVSISGAGSEVNVNGASNVFTGVTSFDDLYLYDSTVSVPNDVSFGSVQADDGSDLSVAGVLTWTDDLSVTDSTITATRIVSGAIGSNGGTVSAIGTESRLVGDVALLGEVYLGSSDTPGDTLLVVEGDVEMGPATEIFAGINDAGQSRLDATGEVELDGVIEVFVGDEIMPGSEFPVLTWGSFTGSIATTLTGNAVTPDTTIEQRDDAVVVAREGGAVDYEQVTAVGITFTAFGPSTALGWPSSLGAVTYDVFVDGVLSATVAGTTATVSVKPDVTSTYRVVAVDGAGNRNDVGQPLDVRIPPVDTCTTTWSGAVNDDWGVAFNWVPVATAPAVPSAPGVPLIGEEVCIDIDTNLPVVVDDIDVDLLAVTSLLLPSDGVIVDITSSTFDAGNVLSVPTVRIDDSFVIAVDINADLIVMSSTTINANSVGARRIEHVVSPTTSGPEKSNIVAAVDADIVDIDEETRLTISQLATPAATALIVRGGLQTYLPIGDLGGLSLLGDGATITIDDAPDNVIDGITLIDTLVLDSIDDLGVTDDLTIGALSMNDSGLLASEDLTIVRSLDAADGNEIRANNITFGTDALVRMVVRPPSQFTAIGASGNMTLAGDLEIDLRTALTGTAPLRLLEWGTATGTIDTTLTGPGATGAEVVRSATAISVRPVVDVVDDVVATGISVDGPARTAAVSLAWPSAPNAVRYEVRTGTSTTASASTTATTATVAAGVATLVTYRVFALDDKDIATPLGSINVFVPSPSACTVTWTGAVDNDWTDANNWAPVVNAPATPPAPSAPGSGALVCVDVSTNLPVAATDVEVALASVTSGLSPAVGLALDLTSSTFEVDGTFAVPGVRLDDTFLIAGTVDADRIVVSRSSIAATTVDAARIEHVDFDSPTKQSDINAAIDVDVIDVAKGTTLDITELSDAKGTTFVVEGGVSVTEPFTQLAGLNLTDRDASITLGADPANLLTGVTKIGTLSLEFIDELSVPNNLTVGELSTQDSALLVDDLLTIERSIIATNGNEVRASDIVFESGVLVRAVVRPPSQFTTIGATNSVTLAGTLDVDLLGELTLGTILPLVTWGSVSGTIGLSLVTDGFDGAELVQGANGIVLQTKGVTNCGPAPDTGNMPVSGCWTDEGDGTYRTTDDQSPAGVAIGGLELGLDDGTVLVLDPNGPSISANDASGAPVDVALSVAVSDKGNRVAALALGRIELDDWDFGSGLDLPIGDLFGIDLGGTPRITAGSDGWDLSFNVELPGILRGASLLGVPIGTAGIDADDLSMENLDGVFAEIFQAFELDVGWVTGNVWRFESIVPDGPSITGDIDFRELNGGGTLSVSDLEVEELVRIPDFDLTGVFANGRDTWVLDVPQPSALRRFGFTYTSAGELVAGALLLGDAEGENSRTSVASWGDWLDVDRLDLRFEGDLWSINGALNQPAVEITGVYRANKTTGATEFVSIDIDGAEIGAFVEFDLGITYDGTAGSYSVDAEIVAGAGPGNTAIDGSGSFTFDDGNLMAASLLFDELRIGEVVTIDDFAFSFVAAEQRFALGGTVSTPTSTDAVVVAGTAQFDGGRLRTATLELDGLALGPVVLDDFNLLLDLPAGQNRTTAIQLTGSVRNRVSGDRLTSTPISGAAILDNGRLQSFDLTVGAIDIGGIAHLDQTTLSYAHEAATGTARLRGSGRMVTADGATSVDASIDLTLRDGDVLSATIESDELSFGSAITIADFRLVYNPDDKVTCEGVTAPPTAISWAASGNTTVANTTTEVSGCLVIEGRRLVAGGLTVGEIRLGSLVTISDLALTVTAVADVPVTDLAGVARTISRTDITLAATATVGTSAPVSLTGSMAVSNGGLVSLQLAIPDLPVANVVQLRNLSFAYDGGTPWDATADVSFKLEGEVVSSNSTSRLDGAITFDADGNVAALRFDAENVDFGAFRIDVLSFVYEGTEPDTRWSLEGSVTAGGRTFDLDGSVELVDGRVVAGEFSIGQLPIGDIVLIENLNFEYRRNADGTEEWRGGGTVNVGDRSVAASADFTFAPDGSLVAGRVDVDRLEWSEMLVFDDVLFEYGTGPIATAWALSGSVVINGETTTLSGSLALQAGRVTSGSIGVENLRLGQIATVQQLTLTAAVTPTTTTWNATLLLASGAEGSGSMRWIDGRLDSATLVLRDLVIGQLVTLEDVAAVYSQNKWAASGTVQNDGRTSSLGGELIFTNGRLTGGALSASDFRFGSIVLDSFDLVIGSSVPLDGGSVSIASVCEVPDPGGVGERWGISARITTGNGQTGELGGRVRIDDKGKLVEGVACAENITIADFVTIETLDVAMSSTDTEETWSGAIELSNPNSDARPFGGSFSFTLAGRRLQAATVTATNLRLSSILDFQNLSLTYDGTGAFDEWAVAAELRKPGTNATIDGSLTVDQGRLVGATLDASNLEFGSVVTFDNVSMTYVGRRAPSNPPSETASQGTWDSLPVSGCAATPTGSNVPSGTPTTTGAESYFAVSATVTSGGQTFAAAGSFGLVGGRMTTFDISVSCLPFGDWLTLEEVRIALTSEGTILFGARLGDDDPTRRGPLVRGSVQLNRGRVVGGSITVRDLSLGAAVAEEVSITLGVRADGLSEWGIVAKVRNKEGELVEGGGSVTLNGRRIVGGTITIPQLPLLDLVPVRNVTLTFDGTSPGELTLAGSASFVKRNGEAGSSVAISLTFADAKLVGGSFSATNLKIFNVIPIGLISVSYAPGDPGAPDGPGPRWSGSFGTQVEGQASSNRPGVQLGIEVAGGRVVSGLIGFGSNGNVDPLDGDGNAPASGTGVMAGLPLKAFHLRFCGANSKAAFCPGGPDRLWDGRLKIGLPTESAPSIDGQVTILNGRFARASLLLEFDPGLPVFTGVTLDTIGAGIELKPRVRFCGEIGASVAAGSLKVASIEANISFSEEFHGIVIPLAEGCSLPAPVVVPEEREPDYFRFLLRANVKLFEGNPLGIDINGTGYLDVQTWGYLGVGASISVNLWRKLAVDAEIRGSVFNASADGVEVFHPGTGERLTGAHAQLSASAGLRWGETNLASGRFVVNTIGFAGCGRLGSPPFSLQAGLGAYWSGGFKLTCDLGRYQLLVPGTMDAQGSPLMAAALSSDTPSSNVANPRSGALEASRFGINPAADTVFRVAPGQRGLGIVAHGVQGAPNVVVIGPDGTRYRLADDLEDAGVLSVTADNDQAGIFRNPAPGLWFVRPAVGSLPIDKVTTYLDLPRPQVTTSLGGATVPSVGTMSFDYSLADVPGQVINFVERDADGAVVGMLGSVMSPIEGRPAPRLADQLPAPTVADLLGVGALGIESTGTSTGTLTYRSNAAPSGGLYEVVALVEQDGLPREEIVVGSYQVAPATKAGVPTAVNATPTADGAAVTWEPPTNDGGRRITGYLLTSTKGFSVAVDADARSGSLPIPTMAPGDTVDVFVQAVTTAGWGDSGRTTFVATGTTGLVYEQTYPDVPALTPIVTPEVIPTPTANDVPTAIRPPDPPGSGVQPPATPLPPAVAPATPLPPAVAPATPLPPVAAPTPAASPPPPPGPDPFGDLPATGGNTLLPLLLAALLALVGFSMRRIAKPTRRPARRSV